MDIWRWVNRAKRDLERSGHDRLAQLIDDLPTLVCDDEHARVEAVVPEALALARAARNPWLEVFVRHWALQSRVLHRYEAREHLAEAVSLLEFANREQTRQCPQSVCVTQDLTSCYANTDGPGYVQERLEVAAETLARIDPSWPCYECISSEYASALSDDERHEEVLAWLQGQIDRAVEAGVERVSRFEEKRAMSLVALGRAAEAWAIMEDYEVRSTEGASGEVDAALTRARVLVALGRHPEAAACLPAYEVIADTPNHYEDYAHAVVDLAEAGQLSNDLERGLQLRRMQARAEGNGALYLAARMAALGTRLAVARGAWTVARAGLADVDRLCAELRRPAGIERLIAEHRAAVDQPPTPALPDEPSALLEALPDEPEPALDRLEAAARRWPEDDARAVARARALAACDLEERAEAVLRAHIERHASAEAVVVELGRVLLRAGRDAALQALVEASMQAEPLRAQGHWLRACSRERLGDLDAAAEQLEALLVLDPEADVPRHRLASVERRRGRHAQALSHLRWLAEHEPPGDHDWDRMTEATIVGDWAQVRDSARRLELRIEGLDAEGPIDVPMGLCRVRFGEDDGAQHDYYAERRGPVTARVVQLAGPRRREHFEDLVVFDAGPVNPRPEPNGDGDGDGDGDDEWEPIYPVVAVLEPGGRRTWALDGVHPGPEAWDALVARLEALGGLIRVRSDAAYQHDDPDDEGRSLPGIYAYACMPEALEPAQLHAQLTEWTAGWERPLVWPELAAALPDGPERQRELARVAEVTDRYAL